MSWFASWYDKLMAPLERGRVGVWRKGLLSRAMGDVLEVGLGTGVNAPYYPPSCRVKGIDPSLAMLERAREKIPQNPSSQIELLLGSAEHLDFPDNTFDTVVATLVLCSVTDPVRSLQEMYRVLKPGGTLLLLEHVIGKHPVVKLVQDVVTPAWKRTMGNCHLNRDTVSLVKKVFGDVQVASHVQGVVVELEAQKPFRERGSN